MQQRTPCEGKRAVGFELREKQQCVRPDIAFGMKLRWLLHALHAGNLGKDFCQEAGFI